MFAMLKAKSVLSDLCAVRQSFSSLVVALGENCPPDARALPVLNLAGGVHYIRIGYFEGEVLSSLIDCMASPPAPVNSRVLIKIFDRWTWNKPLKLNLIVNNTSI